MTSAKVTPAKPDLILLLPVAFLLMMGVLVVYSASTAKSASFYGSETFIFSKQLMAMFVGLACCGLFTFISHLWFRNFWVIGCMVGMTAAVLVGVLTQDPTLGAKRWFHLGNYGFQPAQIAKVVLVVFVARQISTDGEPSWVKRLITILPVTLLFFGLILAQPDFGNVLLIILVLAFMFFRAGFPLRYFFVAGLLLLPLVIGLTMSQTYRMQRIQSFLLADDYIGRQAKLSIGSGGWTGVGVNRGLQKELYLPEAHSDYVFAALCEEFGFAGVLTLFACYLFFFLRGFVIVDRSPSNFSKNLATGLICLVITQALLNISSVLGVVPERGIILPFLSAGGTSMVTFLWAIGILLNISRYRSKGT